MCFEFANCGNWILEYTIGSISMHVRKRKCEQIYLQRKPIQNPVFQHDACSCSCRYAHRNFSTISKCTKSKQFFANCRRKSKSKWEFGAEMKRKDIFIGDQTSWTTVNSNCKPTSNILMLTCKMPRVHSHTWYRINAQKSKYANRCCLCHWESFASLYNVIFFCGKNKSLVQGVYWIRQLQSIYELSMLVSMCAFQLKIKESIEEL